MRVSDYYTIHSVIDNTRRLMVLQGLEYKDFDPVTLAAQAVAVCDSKNKLKAIVKNLKELLARYDQYYSPKIQSSEANNDRD